MKNEKEIKELMKHFRWAMKYDKMSLENPEYSNRKDLIEDRIRSKKELLQLLKWVLE